jgi:hypothetical protein
MNRRTAILTAAAAVLAWLWGVKPKPVWQPDELVDDNELARRIKLLMKSSPTAICAGYVEAPPGSPTRQRLLAEMKNEKFWKPYDPSQPVDSEVRTSVRTFHRYRITINQNSEVVEVFGPTLYGRQG